MIIVFPLLISLPNSWYREACQGVDAKTKLTIAGNPSVLGK